MDAGHLILEYRRERAGRERDWEHQHSDSHRAEMLQGEQRPEKTPLGTTIQ